MKGVGENNNSDDEEDTDDYDSNSFSESGIYIQTEVFARVVSSKPNSILGLYYRRETEGRRIV